MGKVYQFSTGRERPGRSIVIGHLANSGVFRVSVLWSYPKGMDGPRDFATYGEASTFAETLSLEHGWPIAEFGCREGAV